jgi:hypothetical protein
MTREQVEAELLAEGELLLGRREEIERTIAREFRGTMPALTVQAAQIERQRDRVRADLLRIVATADEAAGLRRDEDDEDEGGYGEKEEVEDFYETRERLAARDQELLAAIEALRHRARGLARVEPPPALVDLEHQREQLEAQLRQWRARCRRAGVEATLPRFDEYAAPDD